MRLSISAKVFAGFAAVLATFGLVSAFGVWQMHRIGEGLALVSQAYHPLTRLGAQLEASYRSSEEATRRLLDENDVRVRQSLLSHALEYHPRAARQKVQDALGVIDDARQLGLGGEELPFLDRIEGLLLNVQLRYDAYARIGEEVENTLARLGTGDAAERATAKTELDPALRRLKKVEEQIGLGLRDFSSEVEARVDLRVRQTRNEERRSALMILLLTVVAVVVGLMVTALSQRTLAPIRRLTEAVKDVGEGRFERELAVGSDDELGLLASEFNAMAKKLAERDRQLTEKTAEVLRSERLAAVGRLAAQITHEIRNPLSSLSLNAELLEEQLQDGGPADPEARAETRAVVAAMAREVDRLAEITEEYLRFARLPKPALAAVDLNDAVEDLLDFTAAELAAAKVVVVRELTAEGPAVRADASQLRQVLLNLVRNAREALVEGGRLVVRTRLDPEQPTATVIVEDDGPGIPAEIRAQIFEPFFTTKERGTGLGLALVQQIVHEHGGELSCESAPGHGTRLSVSLPLAPEPLAELARPREVPALAPE